MKITSTLSEALRSLYYAKQRSILVLLGVIIGIGSFIAMVSLGEMVKAESIRQIKEAGIDIFNISLDTGSAKRGQKELTMKEVKALKSDGKSVQFVAPQVDSFGVVKVKNNNWNATVKGVVPEQVEVFKLKLDKGRFLVPLDDGKRVAVLGDGAASRLRQMGLPALLDETITAQGQKFKVIGILQKKGGVTSNEPPDENIYVPMVTAMRNFGGKINTITVKTKKDANLKVVTDELKEILARSLGGLTGINVQSQEALIKQLEEQMRLYTLLLGLIGSISLIVGGIGIMNMMLVAVTEKRKEIGIRRALGAKRIDIQFQFLVESSLLSLIGSIFGIIIGIWASFIAAKYTGLKPLLSYTSIAYGLLTALVVGVFFGFYPARKASRLDPVLALRS